MNQEDMSVPLYFAMLLLAAKQSEIDALKEENEKLREELKEQKGYTVTWRGK